MPFSSRLKSRNSHLVCCLLAPYRNGLVLKGYDLVEYHHLPKSAKGVKGLAEHKYVFNNNGAEYTFYFINNENLETFTSNVKKYLPHFGGFCSWGFANEWGSTVNGKTVGDPEVPPGCRDCINQPPWPWTKTVMGPPADPYYGWSIYQGGLYFNINSGYRSRWEKSPDRFIERARNRWQKYYGDEIGPLNVHSYQDTWSNFTSLTREQRLCGLLSEAQTKDASD
jgi:YHS domain-containing protein